MNKIRPGIIRSGLLAAVACCLASMVFGQTTGTVTLKALASPVILELRY